MKKNNPALVILLVMILFASILLGCYLAKKQVSKENTEVVSSSSTSSVSSSSSSSITSSTSSEGMVIKTHEDEVINAVKNNVLESIAAKKQDNYEVCLNNDCSAIKSFDLKNVKYIDTPTNEYEVYEATIVYTCDSNDSTCIKVSNNETPQYKDGSYTLKVWYNYNATGEVSVSNYGR